MSETYSSPALVICIVQVQRSVCSTQFTGSEPKHKICHLFENVVVSKKHTLHMEKALTNVFLI